MAVVEKGILWVLGKLENAIDDMMKMDKETKALEPSFMKFLSFGFEFYGAFSATRKSFHVGESDPEYVKYYEEVAGKLRNVQNHMKDRLIGIAELLKFLAFQDDVKDPAIKISDSLSTYYNNLTDHFKDKFLENVKSQGPPISILMKLRDQLPKIWDDFTEKDEDDENAKAAKKGKKAETAQMAMLVIIQMITANAEYLNIRFSDEKYAKRNKLYQAEMMEVVRDIYAMLEIKIEYPKFDADKVGEIVNDIASSSKDNHHELIYEALKKEFENDYFLVITYNDNWKQAEKVDDGNTYHFFKEDRDKYHYIVHRFIYILSTNGTRALDCRAACDDAFATDQYEPQYYWRQVPKNVTNRTNSFALYYTTWGGEDAIEYKLNYTIDDEAKAAFYFRDHKIEGADANDKNKKQRATLLATFV